MKQLPIEAVEPKFYRPQPRIPKNKWPYRAQTAPARLGRLDAIAPAEFDPRKCKKCGGHGRVWISKNARTGSLTNVSCPARCRYAC